MIRLVADSTIDMSAEMQKQYGVEVMPMSIQFGDTVYRDGVDITTTEFYNMLEKAEQLPTTSQLNPAQYEEMFNTAKEAGDEMICLVLSSGLSGTYQSALIAKDMVDYDGIYVVDTKSATIGSAMLVKMASEMIESGMPAAKIADELRSLSGRLRVTAMVDTLKYLKMGGRISATTAFVGGVLNICPMIALNTEGKLDTVGKVKGKIAAQKWLLQKAAEANVDVSLPMGFAHIRNEDAMNALKEKAMAEKGAEDYLCVEIGSTIGTHLGPGALAIAWFEK